MNYETDRANDGAGEPSLAEMTEKAIRILEKNPMGFFLMVEGRRCQYVLYLLTRIRTYRYHNHDSKT